MREIRKNLDLSKYKGKEKEDVTLGMVIRDAQGSILLCAVTKYSHPVSSLYAKIKAIRFGLQLALIYGFSSIVIECNSLLAIYEMEIGAIDVSWNVISTYDRRYC